MTNIYLSLVSTDMLVSGNSVSVQNKTNICDNSMI